MPSGRDIFEGILRESAERLTSGARDIVGADDVAIRFESLLAKTEKRIAAAQAELGLVAVSIRDAQRRLDAIDARDRDWDAAVEIHIAGGDDARARSSTREMLALRAERASVAGAIGALEAARLDLQTALDRLLALRAAVRTAMEAPAPAPTPPAVDAEFEAAIKAARRARDRIG